MTPAKFPAWPTPSWPLSFSNGAACMSCRLCREAVSQLFYGLQFDGCAALPYGRHRAAQRRRGRRHRQRAGRLSLHQRSRGWNMYPGQDVTLTGQQARLYIQCRRGDATGNEDRMQRQKQYMLALIGWPRPGGLQPRPSVLPLTTPSATMC